MTAETTPPVNRKSSALLYLMILGLQAATLTTQNEVHVELAGNGNPTVRITVSGCNNTDEMTVLVKKCSTDPGLYLETLSGVCTEEGGRYCFSNHILGEQCAILQIYKNRQQLPPVLVNVSNFTFFDRRKLLVHGGWVLRGNTSTLSLQRPPGAGAASYKLQLSTRRTKHTGNCTGPILLPPCLESREATACLEATVDKDLITFTANWVQEVSPDCKYRATLWAMDDCGGVAGKVRRLPPLQYREPLKSTSRAPVQHTDPCSTTSRRVTDLIKDSHKQDVVKSSNNRADEEDVIEYINEVVYQLCQHLST